MIIDLILDRRDGFGYEPAEFYHDTMRYGGYHAEQISRAMDAGTEQDIIRELARYIIDGGYNVFIIGWVESVKWLEAEPRTKHPALNNSLNEEQYKVLCDYYKMKYKL